MESVYLHRDDLVTIIQIMDSFNHNTVEIEHDNSSGIGDIVKINLHGVDINGLKVTVSKEIINESDW